jgi:hypothetical protein
MTKTRKHRKGRKGITKMIPKTIRKAISRINRAVRSAARGVDKYALIKGPKMILRPILKSRFTGRKHKRKRKSRKHRKQRGGYSHLRLHPSTVASNAPKKTK